MVGRPGRGSRPSKGVTLFHSSDKIFDGGKPGFDAFYGDADFQKTFPNEFGKHTYGIELPDGSKILDLNKPSPEANEFMAKMAKHGFPEDVAFHDELLKNGLDGIDPNGEPIHEGFYELWNDKNHIIAALKDSEWAGVKYNSEYLLPKSTTAKLRGGRIAPEDLPSAQEQRDGIMKKLKE